MPLTDAQTVIYRSLMGEHAAVAAFDLGADAVLVARNAAGDVERILVLTHGGVELDPDDALQRLIAARALAQQQETQATEHLRALLVDLRRRDVEVNLKRLARETGIARSTVYSWLDDVDDDAAE